MSCTNCGKPGHDISSYYCIIGYPVRTNSRGRGRGRNSRGGRSTQASVLAISANVAQVPAQRNTPFGTSNATTIGNASLAALTPDVVSRLLSLVEPSKLDSDTLSGEDDSPIKWLLDSGASHHMIGCLEALINVENIMPSPVGLPDGVQIMAQKCGSIVLGPNFVLTNVLYVPHLSCNLISIAQLIYSTSYQVTLTDKLCVIQDSTSRTLIGLGEQKEGVYVYKLFLNSVYAVSGHVSSSLWHQRLGHPSDQKLSLLPYLFHSHVKDNGVDACDICYSAKQTRNKFQLSDVQSQECFELIHYDIWGPYSISSTSGAHYFLIVVDDLVVLFGFS